jgi:photosystem II stability/assembly factor-like uncharacterized protein
MRKLTHFTVPVPLLRVSLLVALAMPQAVAAQWVYTNTGAGEFRGLSAVRLPNRGGPPGIAVWASGSRASVVRSTDGGHTWKADSVAEATGLDFRSILGLSDDFAIMASAGDADKGQAKVFTRGDGTWKQSFETTTKGDFFDAIQGWDQHTFVILSDPVDSAFGLFMTGDGGTSWLKVPAAKLPKVLPGEAAFAASGTSLVLRGRNAMWIGTGGGGKARVMHSPDRGATWTVVETPVHAVGPASGIFSLAFFDDRIGVAVGGDYTKPKLAAMSVALTVDGGKTWRAAKAPPAAYLSGVAYAGSADKLVAVGLAGTFASSDSGNTWTQVDTVAMNTVKFLGANGWAVGPRGRVARWEPKSP